MKIHPRNLYKIYIFI